MTLQQKIKIRIEFGPDFSVNISPFAQRPAFDAVVTAVLRAMTVENLYADAEFVGAKDGVTATFSEITVDIGGSGSVHTTYHSEFQGTVTLELPDSEA